MFILSLAFFFCFVSFQQQTDELLTILKLILQLIIAFLVKISVCSAILEKLTSIKIFNLAKDLIQDNFKNYSHRE
jgi:hypothetical protein